MVGAAHVLRLMRGRDKKILGLIDIPLMRCLRHQAMNLVLQAGKAWVEDTLRPSVK